MAKTNIIAGLDVGSGKLTCIAAAQDYDTGTLQVLAGRSAPCRGVEGGVVKDIRETSAAVQHVLGGVERELNENISTLIVGLRGSHLSSYTSHGTYNISRMDKEITQTDINLAIENAKAISIDSDKEIINTIPQGFLLINKKAFPTRRGWKALYWKLTSTLPPPLPPI